MNRRERNLAFAVIGVAIKRLDKVEQELLKDDCSTNHRELVTELKYLANLLLRVGIILRPIDWTSLELYDER